MLSGVGQKLRLVLDHITVQMTYHLAAEHFFKDFFFTGGHSSDKGRQSRLEGDILSLLIYFLKKKAIEEICGRSL